jgi:hypothetical protein
VKGGLGAILNDRTEIDLEMGDARQRSETLAGILVGRPVGPCALFDTAWVKMSQWILTLANLTVAVHNC